VRGKLSYSNSEAVTRNGVLGNIFYRKYYTTITSATATIGMPLLLFMSIYIKLCQCPACDSTRPKSE